MKTPEPYTGLVRVAETFKAFKGTRADVIAIPGYFIILFTVIGIIIWMLASGALLPTQLVDGKVVQVGLVDTTPIQNLIEAIAWLTLSVAALKFADKTGNAFEGRRTRRSRRDDDYNEHDPGRRDPHRSEVNYAMLNPNDYPPVNPDDVQDAAL